MVSDNPNFGNRCLCFCLLFLFTVSVDGTATCADSRWDAATSPRSLEFVIIADFHCFAPFDAFALQFLRYIVLLCFSSISVVAFSSG